MNFKRWINLFENKDGIGIRYIHNDGRGLMNNASLNYDKLNDDEYFEVEEDYIGLRQPPTNLHNMPIIFVFTNEGEQRHKRLIELLMKASKKGVRREELNLNDYQIVWDSGDGQLGIIKTS